MSFTEHTGHEIYGDPRDVIDAMKVMGDISPSIKAAPSYASNVSLPTRGNNGQQR